MIVKKNLPLICGIPSGKNSYHPRLVLQARQTLLEIEMNAKNLFLEPNPHTV